MRDTGPLTNLKRHCTIFSPTKEHIKRWTIRAALFLQLDLVTMHACQHDVTTQWYHKPNIKNDAKCWILNPNPNMQFSKIYKERLLAGCALGLGFLGGGANPKHAKEKGRCESFTTQNGPQKAIS